MINHVKQSPLRLPNSRQKSDYDTLPPTLTPMTFINTRTNNNDINTFRKILSNEMEKIDTNPCINDIMMAKIPENDDLNE